MSDEERRKRRAHAIISRGLRQLGSHYLPPHQQTMCAAIVASVGSMLSEVEENLARKIGRIK